MFATIYIYVLLFEFQNMFATMYGCSSFDELLRSKVKNGKKGEEALRSGVIGPNQREDKQ